MSAFTETEGPELPPPGAHITIPADEGKRLLSELTGWPPGMIYGYAYLLTRADGTTLCFGSNGATRADMAKILRQAADATEAIEDYPDQEPLS